MKKLDVMQRLLKDLGRTHEAEPYLCRNMVLQLLQATREAGSFIKTTFNLGQASFHATPMIHANYEFFFVFPFLGFVPTCIKWNLL